MKGSQIHIALAHWKGHTPRVEKLSKALILAAIFNFRMMLTRLEGNG
jgi:hypothetical protein